MRGRDWKEPDLLLFHRLWAEGASYGVMSRQLSDAGRKRTRSAVAGKAKRLGLRRGPTPPTTKLHKAGRRPPRVRKPAVIRVRTAPVLKVLDVVLPGRECHSVFELDNTRCRYPHGEPRKAGFHFCGQLPQEGSPYCGPHHRLTHVKPKVKR